MDAFGPQARETLYFADPGCAFAYVGLHLPPAAWPVALLHARAAVARALGCSPALLTACLANHYREGHGSIPWHYDEVRAHGDARLVAALSLGAPRRFGLRQRAGGASGETGAAAEAEYLELEAGSVLAMWGRTQEEFEHELPLRPGDGHRISLTFRSIVPGFEDALGAAADDPCVASKA